MTTYITGGKRRYKKRKSRMMKKRKGGCSSCGMSCCGKGGAKTYTSLGPNGNNKVIKRIRKKNAILAQQPVVRMVPNKAARKTKRILETIQGSEKRKKLQCGSDTFIPAHCRRKRSPKGTRRPVIKNYIARRHLMK